MLVGVLDRAGAVVIEENNETDANGAALNGNRNSGVDARNSGEVPKSDGVFRG